MKNIPLFLPDTELSSSSRNWLLVGVWSLAIAGIFSLVLVIARTPGFCDMPLFLRLFSEALVVHVDLSVLVWFLSIACMFWSLLTDGRNLINTSVPYIRPAAQLCFIVGMVFIALSPADPNGAGVMSNYIPVIMSPLFFLGLSLLLCGVGLMLVSLLSHYLLPLPLGEGRGEGCHNKELALTLTLSQRERGFSLVITYGIFTSGIIAIFSVIAFILSFRLLPPQIDGQQYYELGFWGGGHVLQFVHTQILLVCWLWLAVKLKPDFFISSKVLYTLFSIGVIVALATPLPYFLFEVTSPQYRAFFTDGMIMAGGVAPCLLALFIIPMLWQSRASRKSENRALWSALLMSLVLFIYGGFLAGMIRGQNVVIPAHYHGSIVGVTLAFMGITYLLLPRFGYRNVAGNKLAFWQPVVYGCGQLMHISGLAYSGGYGALPRKTPCSTIGILSPDIKAAMGFMGLGGLFAIIGGFMFVIVVWSSCGRHSRGTGSASQ